MPFHYAINLAICLFQHFKMSMLNIGEIAQFTGPLTVPKLARDVGSALVICIDRDFLKSYFVCTIIGFFIAVSPEYFCPLVRQIIVADSRRPIVSLDYCAGHPLSTDITNRP